MRDNKKQKREKEDNFEKNNFKIIKVVSLAILISLFLIINTNYSNALMQQLTVGSCSYAGCSAAGWNDRDNTADGSTLPPGNNDKLTMSDPTFDNRSAINSIIVGHSHSGAGGIKGSLTYEFKNTAETITYCTSTTPNTAGYTYSTITPSGCSWDYSRLTDLIITVTSSGTASKDEYNDYMNFTIDYTLYSDTTAPVISLGNPQNDTFSLLTNTIFYFTPIDENTINNCTLIINGTRNESRIPIINGTQNNISSALSDGYWLWTVNCTDSWNNTGTNATRKLVKVDTTPPVVNLESPANNTPWTATPTVTFRYNTTDIMTNVSSCELIIDDTVRDTNNTPQEGVSLRFDFAPGNGQHNWSVNCTDGNGFEGKSYTYNITVNYAGRTVLSDKPNYIQGENAVITGNNWNDGIITIQINLSNGSIVMWNTTASGGSISTDYFINYSYPTGRYNLSAYEYTVSSNNANTYFDVNQRTVTVYTDAENYYQGERVKINGTNYPPNSIITVNITWAGGQNLTNASSDSAGYFNYNFSINYSAAIGNYNISVYSYFFQNLNATENFTVNQRTADVFTDAASYGTNVNIGITGFFFTLLGTVNLSIFQNSSGTIAPLFPTQVNANSTGGFNYTWNTSNTCSGVYGVRAVDANNSFLNDTYYFNLTGAIADYGYSPSACADTDPGCTLSNLLTADDTFEESVNVNGGTDYIVSNFTNSLPGDATITFVRFYIKHYKTGSVSFNGLEWFNASANAYVSVSGCSITAPAANTLEFCDLTNYVRNGSQANNISVRVNYLRTSGGGTAYVDFTHINLTASGTAACTDWNGQAPLIQSILVEDDITSPSDYIDLLAGNTKNINCSLTVYDFDGYSTITGANATLYFYQNITSDPDDNNVHYTNNSCLETGNDGFRTKYYACSFQVYYYANNGTWYCNASARDNTNKTDRATDNTTINSLAALNITPSLIDFGNIETGATSPADIIVNVTNIGNVQLDIGIDGYGASDGDGIAMNCSDLNNISMNDERYNLTSGIAFSSMTPITDTTSILSAFDLVKQTNSTIPAKPVYWKVTATPPARGNCQGSVVFTAYAG